MRFPVSNTLAFCLSLAALAAAAAVSTSTHPAFAQVAPRVQGTYAIRLSAMEAQEAKRIAAIASGLGKLEPEAVKHWQGVLEIMTAPHGRLNIVIANGEVAVKAGERAALKSPSSGAARVLDANRQVTQKLDGDVLVQRFTAKALNGEPLAVPLQVTSRHVLAKDQRALTVQTRMEGGVLSQPADFQVSYDRI